MSAEHDCRDCRRRRAYERSLYLVFTVLPTVVYVAVAALVFGLLAVFGVIG